MKKRLGVFGCLLLTGMLLLNGMSVLATEKADHEELEVTAFTGSDREEVEELTAEEESMLRQLELSEERADMLAEQELAGSPLRAGIGMLLIFGGSCCFALLLWLLCRGKGKRKKHK